jgi:hypothetical protein
VAVAAVRGELTEDGLLEALDSVIDYYDACFRPSEKRNVSGRRMYIDDLDHDPTAVAAALRRGPAGG